jgi:hypothetical protein
MNFYYQAAIACLVILTAFTLVAPSQTFAASITSTTFSENLQLWSKGTDVLALQQFLNNNGFVLAQSGVGSPEHETDVFGSRTYRALVRFQAAHGLQATGFFGPLTRAAANSVSPSSNQVEGNSNSSTTSSPSASTSPQYIPSVTPLPGYLPNQIIFGGGGPPPPTCTISASPTNITIGSSTVLTWTSSNATSASINQSIGSVAINGSQSVSPTANTTYIFTVGNSSGTASCNTIISATPTLSVTNSPVTYSGSAQAATITGSVAGTVSSVLYNGSATVPTAAGTYAVTANFAPTDSTDYSSLTAASAGNFLINTTAPTLTTSAASSVATSTAILNGSITFTGGANATQSGFAYGTGATLAAPIATSTLGSQNGTASLSQSLTGLTPNTTYYSRAYATNSGATGYGSIVSFTTSALPAISSIATSSIATSTATVTWTTNVAATSQVNYGTTLSYGTASSSAALVASHSITLTGLTASTTYDFQVESVDAGGDVATSSNQTFSTAADTLAVNLTAPSSGATLSGSSVTLTATTSGNVAVTGVQFEVDSTNIGSVITSSPYTTTWNSTGVSDGSHTLYAVAEDTAGNYATSSVSVTVRNSPPVISAISSGTPTTTSATITWTTDEAATSQVNYGSTTSYGTASSSAALVTSHSITLTGLSASTTYDFQVESVDAAGNTATSSNQTFTTDVVTTWQGLGQAMSLNVQGFNGGANWSLTTRSRHYSNARFRSFRVVIQTFYPTGTPIADTNFASNYNFQVGFEYPYVNGNTGIPARIPVTFNGATSTSYTTTVGPYGYIISDPINLGYWVPAGAFFGLWTTIENAAGGSSPSNTLPYQRNASNYLEKYIGVNESVTSQIAAETALTATSIGPVGTGAGGYSDYFTPAMMLIETDSTNPTVAVIGDSIGYGVGEGTAGNSSIGDPMGDALENAGYVMRGIFENAGYNAVNLSVGSDANKYLSTPSNWTYRKELLELANPTYVINEDIHNDINGTLTSAWAANTAYPKYSVVAAGGGANIYMATQAGTSASSGNGPSGTGSSISDGSVIWAYLLPYSSTNDRAGYVFGSIANVNGQIAAAVPSAQLIQTTVTPQSASTDSWATTANQTASNYFGTNSVASVLNGLIAGLNPLLGVSGYIDANPYLEYNYPTATSLWVVNGTANYATTDGTHPDSEGAFLGQAAITSSLFQSP